MTPSHSKTKAGVRLRYYVSHRLIKNSGDANKDGWRLPAEELEAKLADVMRHHLHIRVSRTADAPLAESITQIVEEVRTGSPDTEIRLNLSFKQPVYCDAPRVAQAVSNLLSNAVRHGAESTPVKVIGVIGGNGIEISVINQGESVPDELRKNLFHPFKRGADTRGEGLGLGLYIASSIALAHGGQIDVSCSNGTTAFTFYAPLQEVAL